MPGRPARADDPTNDPSPVGIGIDRDTHNYTRRSKIRLFVYAAPTLVERGEVARGRASVSAARADHGRRSRTGPPAPHRHVDEALVERVRRGDEMAFAAVHARYRAILERYAVRMLGSRATAEDVVQDVFIRAHAAILRDDRHLELKPWLYRLPRNRALDELRKPKADHVALYDVSDQPQVGTATDPVEATAWRQQLREVVADLAQLPDRQRDVLLRRELDGLSHEQVAAETGITVGASKKLVNRARENLVKQATARTASCATVRRDLLRVHDGQRRASAHTYRHQAGCGDCRAYRSALGATRSRLAALSPLPLLGAIGSFVSGLVGGGGATAKAATTVAVTAAVAGGALGPAQITKPGQPSPLTSRV